MPERRWSALNVSALLSAVEAAPPLAAADVVGDALAETLGARHVSFLIADYSGRSLIRLSHVGRGAAPSVMGSRERTEAVPLMGTTHGRALERQRVGVVLESRVGAARSSVRRRRICRRPADRPRSIRCNADRGAVPAD